MKMCLWRVGVVAGWSCAAGLAATLDLVWQAGPETKPGLLAAAAGGQADEAARAVDLLARSGLAGTEDWLALYPQAGAEARWTVIRELGRSPERAAREFLAGLARGGDPALAEAAVAALGQGGTRAAAEALEALRGEVAEEPRQWALARCAEGLEAAGEAAAARRIWAELEAGGISPEVRLAGLRGVYRREEQPADWLCGRIAAAAPGSRRDLIRLLAEGPEGGGGVGARLLGREDLTPEEAVQVLLLAARRGDTSIRPWAREWLGENDAERRAAALEVMPAVGRPEDIPVLLALAAGGTRAEQRAAEAALAGVPGEDFGAALLEMGGQAEAADRITILQALTERAQTEATPLLLAWAGGPEEPTKVRIEALKSLARLAPADAIPALVRVREAAAETALQAAAEQAVYRIAARQADPARVRDLLRAEAERSPEAGTRAALTGILARLEAAEEGAEAAAEGGRP